MIYFSIRLHFARLKPLITFAVLHNVLTTNEKPCHVHALKFMLPIAHTEVWFASLKASSVQSTDGATLAGFHMGAVNPSMY